MTTTQISTEEDEDKISSSTVSYESDLSNDFGKYLDPRTQAGTPQDFGMCIPGQDTCSDMGDDFYEENV